MFYVYFFKYKVSLTVYKCFHDLAPEYLKELLQPKITYSHLRSSNDIYSLQTVIPNSKYGESSFSYIAPITWNCLPQSVQLAPSLECFKTRLKSHYFTECYGNDWYDYCSYALWNCFELSYIDNLYWPFFLLLLS